jgi:hypothetical protein
MVDMVVGEGREPCRLLEASLLVTGLSVSLHTGKTVVTTVIAGNWCKQNTLTATHGHSRHTDRSRRSAEHLVEERTACDQQQPMPASYVQHVDNPDTSLSTFETQAYLPAEETFVSFRLDPLPVRAAHNPNLSMRESEYDHCSHRRHQQDLGQSRCFE